jgi:type IV pilus assembly protein PilE
MKKSKGLKAFTLPELLIVLIIIGILILIALPKLMPLISKTRSTEAKTQLKHIYTLQETYRMEFAKYSSDFVAIGFEHEKLTTEGGSANYRIEIIESTTNSFKAAATAIVDFDGDGQFNRWEIDQDKNLVEVTPD